MGDLLRRAIPKTGAKLRAEFGYGGYLGRKAAGPGAKGMDRKAGRPGVDALGIGLYSS